MVFFLFFILFCIESKTENEKHKAVLKVIKRKRLMMITVVKGVRNEKWNKKICWILNERRADWCRVLNGFKKFQLVNAFGAEFFYGMIWLVQCITTLLKIVFSHFWLKRLWAQHSQPWGCLLVYTPYPRGISQGIPKNILTFYLILSIIQ